MNRTAAFTTAALCALLLSGCTGGPASAPSADQVADDSATPTPTASAVEAAPSCLQIDTSEPTVDGTTLGTCINDALYAIGTFKASSNMSGEPMEAEIRLRPDIALHGTSPDSEVVYLDGIAYDNDGDGWVKGDIESDDSEEYVAGLAGQALLAAFAGDIMKQTIAACPVWNIETGTKKITLPNDIVVDARVFACAGPVDMLGTVVDPMSVWMGADWTPYGYQSTTTGYGQVIEGVSYYYDHGKPVEIEAPI